MRIIGSERIADFSILKKQENGFLDALGIGSIQLFSSGRSAIHLLFSKVLRNKRIAMPDLLCAEVLKPAGMTNSLLTKYRIKNDFTADLHSVDFSSDVIFIIDYYGFRDTALFDAAKEAGMTIVIDRTHSLLSDFPRGHYETGSLRKIFPVPDGGFLTGRFREIRFRNAKPEWPYLKLLSKSIRQQYELTGYPDLEQYYVSLSEKSENRISMEHTEISEISENIIRHYPIAAARKARRRNFRILADELSSPLADSMNGRTVPQSFPILVPDRDRVKACLNRNSIYAPVLWRCASMPSAGLLNLPIDEEYSIDDMKRIISNFRKCNADT